MTYTFIGIKPLCNGWSHVFIIPPRSRGSVPAPQATFLVTVSYITIIIVVGYYFILTDVFHSCPVSVES